MESILTRRIYSLCEARGITVKKLAEDCGICPSLIRKWKTSSSPSIDKIKPIAEYLGVSTDYLIGLSNIQEPVEKLMGDEDFVSLQRARNRMSAADRSRMMNSLRATFDYAFSDENEEDKK